MVVGSTFVVAQGNGFKSHDECRYGMVVLSKAELLKEDAGLGVWLDIDVLDLEGQGEGGDNVALVYHFWKKKERYRARERVGALVDYCCQQSCQL